MRFPQKFHEIELASEIIRRNAGLEEIHNIGSGLKLTNYLKKSHNTGISTRTYLVQPRLGHLLECETIIQWLVLTDPVYLNELLLVNLNV